MELINIHHSEEHGNRQAVYGAGAEVKILHIIHKQEAERVGGRSGIGL